MLRLIRVEHSIIGGIGVVVGAIITTRLDQIPLDIERIMVGALVTILLIAGGFALNDYFDVEVDRKNKRMDRPLVSGDLTEREVQVGVITCLFIGLIIATLLGLILFVVAGVWLIFGILYDYKLKEWGLIGNLYVATTYGVPWIYGSLLFLSKNLQVWIAVGTLSLIAFIAGLGREILKGVMDVEGDELRNVQTIARMHGTQTAAYIAAVLIFGAILATPFPYFFAFKKSWSYLILVTITNLILFETCSSLLKDQSYDTARRARNRTLIAFILGALAFLGGVIGP